MAIESVMLSCIIDAMEKRDVATVNIPCAFMHADMDDEVHMRLEGKMAELLVQLNSGQYSPHVTIENGKQVRSICQALEGAMRHTQGGSTILEASVSKASKLGFHRECV